MSFDPTHLTYTIVVPPRVNLEVCMKLTSCVSYLLDLLIRRC